MQNFMKIIISAIKTWVKHDAFTADDAMEALIENNFVEPLRTVDGTIYTAPNGDVYVL